MRSFLLIIFLISLSTVFLPGLAWAACDNDCSCEAGEDNANCPNDCDLPCPPGSVCLPNPLKFATFNCLIDSITSFILIVSLALAPLLCVIAAFYLMTAGGDPARVKTAQTIFIYTGVGLLIAFLAKALVAIVRAAVGVV